MTTAARGEACSAKLDDDFVGSGSQSTDTRNSTTLLADPIPLDVLGELIQYSSPKIIGRLSLLCRATAGQFVWKRLRTIDFALGDEMGDDWCDAMSQIKESSVQTVWWPTPIETFFKTQTSGFQMASHVVHLRRVASSVRVLSIALRTPYSKEDFPCDLFFSALNPSILEEISVSGYLRDGSFVKFITTNAFPRLHRLRFNAYHDYSYDLVEKISKNCPSLQELCLSTINYGHSDLQKLLKLGIPSLSVPYGFVTEYLAESWKLLDISALRAKLGLIDFDLSKIQIDGASLWYLAMCDIVGPCEDLYRACHPMPTPFALYNILSVLKTHYSNTQGLIWKEKIAMDFFLGELQKWRPTFEEKDLLERTVTPGWSLFCECLAYIFHLSPSVSHKREALDLIALSPSVLDIVGFREINRQSAVDDSTPAVVDIISDTAWWNTMKRDLNLSQQWGLHAIHNLTLSGPAVLAAIESKLLDWTLRPHSIHLFVTLIGKRHTCGSAGVAQYDEALAIAYRRVKKLGVKPLSEPLLPLELATLGSIDRLETCLKELCATWRPIVAAAALLSPNALKECLSHVCGAKIPTEVLVEAANAYWKPIVSGRLPSHLSYAATVNNFIGYLRSVMENFPVVPNFVFQFLASPPKRQPTLYVFEAAVKVLTEAHVDIKQTPKSHIFIQI